MKSKMAIAALPRSKYRKTVLCVVLKSHLLLMTLFVLWRAVADHYDTLNRSCLCRKNSDWSFPIKEVAEHHWGLILGRAIENYVEIAEGGYEYEQAHVFPPVYPLLMRFVARTVLSKRIPLVGFRPTLAFAGYLINNVSFTLAAFCLFQLTESLLEDGLLALAAAALFCFNPASTFFSAAYYESLFALLSLTGLLCFVKGAKWCSVILFSLSSGVRLSGVWNAGFFLFQAMQETFDLAVRRRNFLAVVPRVLVALMQSFAVAIPFLAFQLYGYLQMCYIPRMKPKSPARPRCSALVPYLYGFVQRHYWNAGFLRYFQLKQLPNFLLSSPILILAMGAIVTYARQQPKLFVILGLVAAASAPSLSKVALLGKRGSKGKIFRDREERSEWARKGFFSPAAVCFLVQLGFMTSVALFVMHAQVATRFLSVSPPVYWWQIGAERMK